MANLKIGLNAHFPVSTVEVRKSVGNSTPNGFSLKDQPVTEQMKGFERQDC